MSAHANSPSAGHDLYLSVLPAVASVARRRFGNLPAVDREEAVAEAIATGFVAYLSLVGRGRPEQVRTAGFAINAARAVAGGRRVGSSQAGKDVLSTLGRRRRGEPVLSFDTESDGDRASDRWLHDAVMDKGTPVPDQVAIRVDGGRWLASLSARDRRMVEALASGERPLEVAQHFNLSQARISQLRRQWAAQWHRDVSGTV